MDTKKPSAFMCAHGPWLLAKMRFARYGLARSISCNRAHYDHARRHAYAKRGGGAQQVSLDDVAMVARDLSSDLVQLDEALKTLAKMDARRCHVVELRYFGGLSNEEIAGVLKVSENTVTRDWNLARAWLYQHLSGSAAN